MNNDKRGSLTDTIFIPVYILVVAITIFIAFNVWGGFKTNFIPIVNGTNVANVGNQSVTLQALEDIQVSFDSFDYAFPFLVGGLMFVSLILAFKRGASAIYAVFSIIIWALAMLMSAVFTNVFGQFETTFPATAASLPIIAYIMNNMKWVVFTWLFLISVVMFTRDKKDDQNLAAAERAFG